MKHVFIWFYVASVSLCINSCGGDRKTPKTIPAPQEESEGTVKIAEAPIYDLLQMSLFDAPSQEMGTAASVLADLETLSQDETNALLARLEPLPKDEETPELFVAPKGSIPPPRAGQTMLSPFPSHAEASPPAVGETTPLKVVRYAPSGDVTLAPHLSVTFSKPMVAVSSQEQVATHVPVELVPQPKGSWRWLGTKTLMFSPDSRFPAATDFRAKIPLGTRSTDGDILERTFSFSFGTPTLKMEKRFPNTHSPQGLSPIIAISFNQRIDPKAVAKYITLRSTEGIYPHIVLERDALYRERELIRQFAEVDADRLLILKPKSPLPKGTLFDVILKPGAPSAEGPKKTTSAQSFSFRTYEPFAVDKAHCKRDAGCRPTDSWIIRLNNPIDEDTFDAEAINITPSLRNREITAYHRTIQISGFTSGRTTYEVTLPANLNDAFGQSLQKTKPITFDIGPAEQALLGPKKGLITLDPGGPKTVSFYTVNHSALNVTINRVVPDDFHRHRTLYMQHGNAEGGAPLVGTPVFSEVIEVNGKQDTLTETVLHLTPYLNGGFGQFLVHVTPVAPADPAHPEEVRVWVQVTDLGLTAFIDDDTLMAFVTHLADGRPVPGATLQLSGGTRSASVQSDSLGLGRLALGAAADKQHLLIARRGGDTVILPHDPDLRWGSSHFHRTTPKDSVQWYVFDDRGIYRPGETAHVKGWFRKRKNRKGGGVTGLDPLPKQVSWILKGSRRNTLLSGTAPVSRLGGFHIALELPKEMNLGAARLTLRIPKHEGIRQTTQTHFITVAEFRRPEFEVLVTSDPGPHIIGNEAYVTLRAGYYAGGGLRAANTNWQVIASPAVYTPPDADGYRFGLSRPRWFYDDTEQLTESRRTHTGITDSDGVHRLGIRFDAVKRPAPVHVTLHGRVTDLNQQAWSGSDRILVHPSSVYVGLKPSRNFYPLGEPVEIEATVVDLSGKPVSSRPVVLVFSKVRRDRHGAVHAESLEPCREQSLDTPVRCRFTPKKAGLYRVDAMTEDDAGRPNRTEMLIWITGGETHAIRSAKPDAVTLIPEKEHYAPGEVAALLVKAPFYPAHGVMTVERAGIIESETFRMEQETHLLFLPVQAAHIPNIRIRVNLVGTDSVHGRDAPAHASGSVTLRVPPLSRTLDVSLSPRSDTLAPGETTHVDIEVRDAAGKPVAGAELAVVVADESVLALTNYRLPDPIDVFYANYAPRTVTLHSRDQLQSHEFTDSGNRVVTRAAPIKALGRTGAVGNESPPTRPVPLPVMANTAETAVQQDAASITTRADFDALALFAPEVTTDADGRASLPMTLPDSLTRYRIMAVAVAATTQFGSSESVVTTRLPLMVRPSPPRFLNFQDRFAMPILIQNQTERPMNVKVALQARGVRLLDSLSDPIDSAARVTDAVGYAVTVPPLDRVVVPLPAAATSAGRARFQVAISGKNVTDAQAFDLPVLTPATTEAFATYGTLDSGHAVQPITPPENLFPQFGALSVTAASTALSSLADAVLYLIDYPFECSEQIASRLLAVATLKEISLISQMPDERELEQSVHGAIEKLTAMQNRDGGFGFWRKGSPSVPFVTVHAAHALAVAETAGYAVPEAVKRDLTLYLTRIRDHLPERYSKASRIVIRAYAVYALDAMGLKSTDMAESVLETMGADRIPLEAAGFILPVLKKGGRHTLVRQLTTRINNSVTETAASAHFVTSYKDGAQVLLHSDRRIDGVILNALIAAKPSSDLVPKLVRGLLDHRVQGRWSSTQENAFVLLALRRYYDKFEKPTPHFLARAWLGDTLALSHKFKGRTLDGHGVQVPMRHLHAAPLTIGKTGPGRLYYRIGLTFAPKAFDLEPSDHGFVITRTYEGVDNPKDVVRDKHGIWRIKAGTRVRVTLTMATPMRRYHVALTDPLPAGFEGINPGLANTTPVPDDSRRDKWNDYWWWHRPWYEHQNLRDDRTEAFAALLWDGVHTYTYSARATTRGSFIVPPARAEEMYHPETFGRSGTDRVVIE